MIQHSVENGFLVYFPLGHHKKHSALRWQVLQTPWSVKHARPILKINFPYLLDQCNFRWLVQRVKFMKQFTVKKGDKERPKRDQPKGVRIAEGRPQGPLCVLLGKKTTQGCLLREEG